MTTFPASQDLQPFIQQIATEATPELVEQLIAKSKQPNILKYTPNDTAKRFGDKEMFEKWRAGGREIHWLLGVGNDLAGILWYGKKDFPLKDLDLPETPQETLAIRLYDGYTGHGLARPAMSQSLTIHVKAAQERGETPAGIWLQTDTSNAAAIATYSKFGYQEVHRDAKRVTMILPASQVRAKSQDAL